jgi:hypothetical protein
LTNSSFIMLTLRIRSKVINYIPLPLQRKLRDIYYSLLNKRNIGHGEFAQRIRHRYKTFWETRDAEIVRNTIMDSSDPIIKWKDVENWQRKLSNKYNAKEFAKLNSCKVAETFWRGRDVDKINFDKLPKQYVIKPTIGHSCDLVFLFDHSINLLDNRKYPYEVLIETLKTALEKNSNLEFIIEEFLKTEQGEFKIPIDYKFYMFNGIIATIHVVERFSYQKKISGFYDEGWNEMEHLFSFKGKLLKGRFHQPPKFHEMIEYAKRLSKAYEIFVRIDLYATDKGTVFGEFTPTPSKGNYFTSHADKMLLKYWEKFCKGKI